MNDHIGKPLDFTEFLKKLRAYLPINSYFAKSLSAGYNTP
jgi:hypothetical protein